MCFLDSFSSPHTPFDAWAAASSYFLCTSTSATREAERGAGTSAMCLSMAAQLFSCLQRQEQRGQAVVPAPTTSLFARAVPFFRRTEISIADRI